VVVEAGGGRRRCGTDVKEVRKGGEARRGWDAGGAVRRRGRWRRPAAVVLVRHMKKNGEEKEPEKGENQRKKKEVER
jgi:hypothetical protein